MAMPLGAAFAPTPDNAQLGQRNGQLSGIPQAIQVLSMRLPQLLGAGAPASPQLLNAPGGQGVDPQQMALLTLLRTFMSHAQPGMPGGGLPNGGTFPSGGTAQGPIGPGPWRPQPPGDRPGPGGMTGPPMTAKPRVSYQDPMDPPEGPAAFRSGGGFMGRPRTI